MLIKEKIHAPEKLNDVVLIGEVLIDKIYEKSSETSRYIMGGSTSNISVNLKHLEQKPIFVGAVGNDQYGDEILQKLKSSVLNVALSE